jgi:hypothetical protein
MNKFSVFLEKYISYIIAFFLIVQPILDVISGISQHILSVNFSLNVIIRFLFLLCAIFYLLFINNTKYKKISLIYLFSIFIYSILFCTSVLYFKGFDTLFYETKNLILVFYFPILLITFFNLFDQYDIKISLKYFIYTYLIYLLFIFVPNILGVSFESYTQGKIGNSGWFNSANAISSILSILLPFVIIYFKNNKPNYKIFIFIILLFYSILSLGTKVPLLSVGIILLGNCIYLIYILIKNKKFKSLCILTSLLIIMITSLILIIPKTNFYKNIQIHLNFLGVEHASEIVTNINIIDRFIFSDRLTFLLNTKNVYDNSSIYERLIGIGYIENYGTDNVSTKMIEMDYYDIYYRHGIIGTIIYFIPLIYIIYLLSKKWEKLNFYSLNALLSVSLIFLLAFFSGHIFTVPNVSIFICYILVIIYYCHNLEIN